MTDFAGEDLTGSRFEDFYLTDAWFHDVDLTNARFHLVDMTGVMIRGAAHVNVGISGEIKNLWVNGGESASRAICDRAQALVSRPHNLANKGDIEEDGADEHGDEPASATAPPGRQSRHESSIPRDRSGVRRLDGAG